MNKLYLFLGLMNLLLVLIYVLFMSIGNIIFVLCLNLPTALLSIYDCVGENKNV